MPEIDYARQLANRDAVIERHEICIVALEAHIEELKKYIKELERKLANSTTNAKSVSPSKKSHNAK